MKEIEDIVNAYRRARGTSMALATVVTVEGSSYRRPGARMLVMDDGSLVGAISGGCLEGDAKRKAMFAMSQGKTRLATYDTSDEDGEMFGIQLGCHGVISILFEPILAHQPNHPLALLERITNGATASCLVTLFTPGSPEEGHPGTCLLRGDGLTSADTSLDQDTCDALDEAAALCLQQRHNLIQPLGDMQALLHYIAAPVTLVIAGAGNDAMPLARFASELGWHVTVIDGRATHATTTRFPTAHAVQVVKAGEALPEASAYVMMSHNFPYDLAALRQLHSATPQYIGLLGPARRRDELLRELGGIADQWGGALHGPAGLDIGAETAEEIALSILAEIKATMEGASGGALRAKVSPIHARAGA